MQIITNPRERIRFIRFAIVGTIGAIVDFTTFNILRSGLNVNLQLSGAIAFTTAVISNFLWNRFWTYPDSRSKSVTRQLIEFFLINLMGLGIRMIILSTFAPFLENLLSLSNVSLPLTPTVIGDNIALATALGIVMFWNFFANRYWTYSDVE
jgi:putative flippase GtrA